MMAAGSRVIDLTEHVDVLAPSDALEEPEAQRLYERFSEQVEVEEPSRRHPGQWLLRANGYVGFIPVSARLALRLNSKVPLRALFGMLEVAYRLDPAWLPGLHAVGTLEEFYERLAMILARRVLDRARRGLYRRYVRYSEQVPFVRGAIDLHEHVRRPWATQLCCEYEEHSSDVIENQILAWTLSVIARSGLCSERVRPTVRRAFHVMQGGVAVAPVTSNACVRKTYDRLCEDYRPLHALCRFFLDHSGASHIHGDRLMLPFLIKMDVLFEKFVAGWLREHLPAGLELAEQERLQVGQRDDLEFRIDLVIRDERSRRPLIVLDTKYKSPERPAQADIAQVVTYAEGMGCREAVLVYPLAFARPLRERVGEIRVRSLTFDLSGELDRAGAGFLAELLEVVSPERAATPTKQ